MGAPRRSCKKAAGGFVSVTVISTETVAMSHKLFPPLHPFQRPRLGLPEAGRRGRGGCLPSGGLSALRREASQRDLPAQAVRSGGGSSGRCSALQLLLRDLPGPREATVGAFLRAPVLCRGAVPPGERAGSGRRRAPANDRTALWGSGLDAEALAALVARDLSRRRRHGR